MSASSASSLSAVAPDGPHQHEDMPQHTSNNNQTSTRNNAGPSSASASAPSSAQGPQAHRRTPTTVPVAEEVEVADAAVAVVLPGFVTASSVAIISDDQDFVSAADEADSGYGIDLPGNGSAASSSITGDVDEGSGGGRGRRRRVLVGLLVSGFVVAVALAVAVALSVVPGGTTSTADEARQIPQQEIPGADTAATSSTFTDTDTTIPPHAEETVEESERFVAFRSLLEDAIYVDYSNDNNRTIVSPLRDPTKYQYSALRWLADVDGMGLLLPDESNNNDDESGTVGGTTTKERTGRIVQRYALAALYYGTSGDGWRVQSNFLDGTAHECQWNAPLSGTRTVGVGECNGGGWVTHLSLARNRLISSVGNGGGGIPDEVFELRHLDTLHLGGNDLKGTLSPRVNQLTKLRILALEDINLSGELPSMAGMEMLESLDACCNELTTMPTFGPSPPWLMSIDVTSNRITGTVPLEYSAFLALHTLLISGNFLEGSVDFLCDAKPTIEIVADKGEVSCKCCS